MVWTNTRGRGLHLGLPEPALPLTFFRVEVMSNRQTSQSVCRKTWGHTGAFRKVTASLSSWNSCGLHSLGHRIDIYIIYIYICTYIYIYYIYNIILYIYYIYIHIYILYTWWARLAIRWDPICKSNLLISTVGWLHPNWSTWIWWITYPGSPRNQPVAIPHRQCPRNWEFALQAVVEAATSLCLAGTREPALAGKPVLGWVSGWGRKSEADFTSPSMIVRTETFPA